MENTIASAPKVFDVRLPTSVLNIERKSRSNLFPWRGQFSPQLVESLLRAYAPPGATVLDPFMGSGTVLVEGARLGFEVHGVEVNPAAYLLARVYELCRLTSIERRNLLDDAELVLRQRRPSAFDLPLFPVMATDMSIERGRNYSDVRHINEQVQMLVDALLVLLDESNVDDRYTRKWAEVRTIVTHLPHSMRPIRASLADARALNLTDDSIDFVLSSPPYINVFNYHHNSRRGIEALGWKPLVAARSEIGSNRKFRQNRFLTVIQYCIDMCLVLAELNRVCNREARIVLVLGRESNVHKTPFFNGRILKQLAIEIFGMCLHQEQERVFLNRFGQAIYEDLLFFTRGGEISQSKADITTNAKAVGKGVLVDALQRTPPDRLQYLHDAIAMANQIDASPMFDPDAANGESQ